MTAILDTDTQLDLSGLAPLHPVLPHVVTYTLPVCPNCDSLKRLLKAAKFPTVSIPIEADDDAHKLFVGELGVKQTPVVLVHNTFATPVYFSGFASDLARVVVAGMKERLAVLTAADELSDSGDFVSGLSAILDPEAKTPSIRPEAFAELAESHIARERIQSARVTAPALLTKEAIPAVLH